MMRVELIAPLSDKRTVAIRSAFDASKVRLDVELEDHGNVCIFSFYGTHEQMKEFISSLAALPIPEPVIT